VTSRGTLYALGLGPGAPDLVTVRAADILGRVSVVAYPVDAKGDPGRAYSAAHRHLAAGTEEIPLTLPMTGDREVLERSWDRAVELLEAATVDGRDVAYLCLGDTLLYGSFGYLLARYRGPVEVVPGVISPVAAAAALALPLAEDREPLVVLPDGGDVERLEAALALGGAVVVMKPSRLTDQAVALLEESGAAERALVVQDVSLEAEQIFRPAPAGLASLPYFSLVVLPPAGRRVQAAVGPIPTPGSRS
jgi:precorrin-2/cobalt-factor-2 C20-methyltransferase